MMKTFKIQPTRQEGKAFRLMGIALIVLAMGACSTEQSIDEQETAETGGDNDKKPSDTGVDTDTPKVPAKTIDVSFILFPMKYRSLTWRRS